MLLGTWTNVNVRPRCSNFPCKWLLFGGGWWERDIVSLSDNCCVQATGPAGGRGWGRLSWTRPGLSPPDPLVTMVPIHLSDWIHETVGQLGFCHPTYGYSCACGYQLLRISFVYSVILRDTICLDI